MLAFTSKNKFAAPVGFALVLLSLIAAQIVAATPVISLFFVGLAISLLLFFRLDIAAVMLLSLPFSVNINPFPLWEQVICRRSSKSRPVLLFEK